MRRMRHGQGGSLRMILDRWWCEYRGGILLESQGAVVGGTLGEVVVDT